MNQWVQIGIWGDSIVHGGCDLELGGWVNRLRLYFANRELGDHVFNLGLGGQTSGQVLQRLDSEIEARTGHIDYVMVGVGTNDLLYKLRGEKPPGEFYANLEQICQCIRSRNKKGILLSLTPRQREDCGIGEKLDASIREAAAAYQMGWIDLRTALSAGHLLPDGVHPNAAGHERIFQKVKNYLLEEKIAPAE